MESVIIAPEPSAQPAVSPPERGDLASMVADSRIRRVHMLAWRDLADVEAGGSELHMAKVAQRFAEAGLDVTVRTSYAKGQPVHDWRNGYRVIRRANRYGVFPRAVAAEVTRRYGRIDAVVEAWNGVPFLTPLWFRGPRAVLLHHVHRDMWRQVIDSRLAVCGKFLELRLAPPFYRRTPIIALSPSARDEIITHLRLPAANITLAPPGIDASFEPGPAKADRPLVVAVGRLMPPKRFDELIRVVATVRADCPDLELVITGEGFERSRLEDLVDSLDARDWVRLPGRVSHDELVSLYQRAWVVTATSMAEGWGMTLTEAAACGTPAVATRIAGHRDAVDEGVSGLLGDDSRELVEQLRSILTDDELRQRLSEGARKHAAAFSWDATAVGVFAPLAAQATPRRRR